MTKDASDTKKAKSLRDRAFTSIKTASDNISAVFVLKVYIMSENRALACFNAALLALGPVLAIETADAIWSRSEILQRCALKRPKASDTTHALFVSEKRIYVL